jgi:hypothetical protein
MGACSEKLSIRTEIVGLPQMVVEQWAVSRSKHVGVRFKFYWYFASVPKIYQSFKLIRGMVKEEMALSDGLTANSNTISSLFWKARR